MHTPNIVTFRICRSNSRSARRVDENNTQRHQRTSVHFTRIDKMPPAKQKRRAADYGKMNSQPQEPDPGAVKLEEKGIQIQSHLREVHPVTPGPRTIQDHRTVLKGEITARARFFQHIGTTGTCPLLFLLAATTTVKAVLATIGALERSLCQSLLTPKTLT